MVRPALVLVAALFAACTAPAYTCGHPVPCARGSVQSCQSRDGARCRYLLGDGTSVECAACDDCFAAEREIIAWCAGQPVGTGDGGGTAADLGGVAPPDLSAAMDFGDPPPDLATPRADLSTVPPGDMSLGPIDTDLGCYGFPYDCQGDPGCCTHCCAGGCAASGNCALF